MNPMSKEELIQIKRLAFNYSDPIRGKILALIANIEVFQDERERLLRDSEILTNLKICGVEKLQCWEQAWDMYDDVE